MDAAEHAATRPRFGPRPTTLIGLVGAAVLLKGAPYRPPGFRKGSTTRMRCPLCRETSHQVTGHSGYCTTNGWFRWCKCFKDNCDAFLISTNGFDWACRRGHRVEALLCPACHAPGLFTKEEYVCTGSEEHRFFRRKGFCDNCKQGHVLFLGDSPTATCEACDMVWQREQQR